MPKRTDKTTIDQNPGEDPGAKSSRRPSIACSNAAGYEIRVKDHLDSYWLEWFEGWSVTNLENGEVLLKGEGVDQSKLHGALNRIRDLNLTLLSVKIKPGTV